MDEERKGGVDDGCESETSVTRPLRGGLYFHPLPLTPNPAERPPPSPVLSRLLLLAPQDLHHPRPRKAIVLVLLNSHGPASTN